jgi:hypothetical protein
MKMVIGAITLAFLLGGCLLVELLPEPEDTRSSPSGEGPTDIRLHSAILNDVRRELLFEQHLQDGRQTCSAVKLTGATATCAIDNTEMSVLILRADSQSETNPSKETAYFCPTESIYYYRYEGGPRKLDVWLGPYKIRVRGH